MNRKNYDENILKMRAENVKLVNLQIMWLKNSTSAIFQPWLCSPAPPTSLYRNILIFAKAGIVQNCLCFFCIVQKFVNYLSILRFVVKFPTTAVLSSINLSTLLLHFFRCLLNEDSFCSIESVWTKLLLPVNILLVLRSDCLAASNFPQPKFRIPHEQIIPKRFSSGSWFSALVHKNPEFIFLNFLLSSQKWGCRNMRRRKAKRRQERA